MQDEKIKDQEQCLVLENTNGIIKVKGIILTNKR